MTISTSHPQLPLYRDHGPRVQQAYPNKLSPLPSLPAQQPSEPEPGEAWPDAYGHLSELLKEMKELRARLSCQRPDAAQSFDKGLPTDSQLACRCTSTAPNPLTADGEDEIDPLAASTHRGVQDRHKYYRPIHCALVIRDSKGARRSKSYEKDIHLYFDQHGFRGFDINLEETQQVINFKPHHYLFLRVHSLAKFATAIRLPTNGVRITAEFRHIVEKVEVRDDSNHLGSATNFNKPCPTPDWYIDLPPDKLPTSIIRFTASSGEEVLFRPQDSPPDPEAPTTRNSDAPHDGENVESQSPLRFATSVDNPLQSTHLWSQPELDRMRKTIKSGGLVDPKDFPKRTKRAVQDRVRNERKKLKIKKPHRKIYTREKAVKVASMVNNGDNWNHIVEAVGSAHEQEIHAEYLNIKMGRPQDADERMMGFLEEK
ncbi:hypothetical protein CEP52_014835 [Fusarium oligoseptatum]|uniref:Uncharacterized protein n=1 Tax=Fusarium oligoseptatum TaxID=2604345 RepID=A0A428SIQ2_9HYPO|nr:hypothetical protein CEP52_014835 [Fusarium oligoseptatum]